MKYSPVSENKDTSNTLLSTEGNVLKNFHEASNCTVKVCFNAKVEEFSLRWFKNTEWVTSRVTLEAILSSVVTSN